MRNHGSPILLVSHRVSIPSLQHSNTPIPMLLTISNLYPRPDQPQRGLFNAQLFKAMAGRVLATGCECSIFNSQHSILNVCLAPEWRIWRWQQVRAWQDPHTEFLDTRYVPVGYLPVVGRNLNWRMYTRGLECCMDLFAQSSCVLATWLYPDGVAAAGLAKRAGKPVWLKVHGTDRFHLSNPVRRKQILSACEYAQGIICNAHYVRQELIAAGIPSAKLHVIANGVDTTLFCFRPKDEAKRELLNQPDQNCSERIVLSKDRPVSNLILFVGNLLPIKGPDILLSAFASLQSGIRNPESEILFLGSGSMLPQLRRQAKRLGIDDRVTFLGSRPHGEIAHWMNVADCLCLPSRSEGMPNVVLEALSSGLPLVATDVGDCGRVLADESAACIVPTEDPAALVDGLRTMLTSDCDRETMSKRHQSRLSWEECARQHLDMMM